jgi:hypothetical protein
VIQLKRFSSEERYSSRSKIDHLISAPEVGLDIRQIMPEMAAHFQEHDSIYDLFATSNHFGGLGGGHCKLLGWLICRYRIYIKSN